nr:TetR/AcrR family transcriptional regulator [Sphingomonas sp. Y57]
MGRPKQALISRRRTLEVALRIIDEEGLDALSIRRLGDELNVRGISLYHHFRSKEHILAGACELALADVRTPHMSNSDWREWLVDNARKYYLALRAHPNLIPILMRRHPLRIGLAEHNATAGLLAVQNVPIGAIMPLMDGLESIALGCAAYQSAVEADTGTDNWQEANPFLFHVSRSAEVSKLGAFEAIAKAAVDAILETYKAENGKADDRKEAGSA